MLLLRLDNPGMAEADGRTMKARHSYPSTAQRRQVLNSLPAASQLRSHQCRRIRHSSVPMSKMMRDAMGPRYDSLDLAAP